ncbi:uncharacterized protein VTP21DRAFT_9918 [Calcarisporiella thermophila]|uniref:uncharacterized protein n=1 Tax=Calcarisporiella thermophila TaxID=911321 RepID=UPI003743DD1A
MHLFFGKGNQSKNTAKDAILKLRENIQMLEKRESFLQTRADEELKKAKAMATKNKRAALISLRKRKEYESQIEKVGLQRINLESQVMAIENASVNFETMNAMRKGAEAMKSIHGSMNVNKVDEVMDQIRDQMDVAEEISSAITQPLASGAALDDAELEAELEELEQQELDEQMLSTPSPALHVPKVPTHEPNIAEEEDEDEQELRELQRSMEMS